jgi:hypothetical protein
MRARSVLAGIAFTLAAFRSSEALAGMPMPVLTDWAAVRFETLSFFLAILLVTAAVIRWLWNSLARDFTAMPRLGYRSVLAGVVLIGLLLAVVLTMIAGARELLTPGAWQRQGLLYKVAAPPESAEASAPTDPPAPADAPLLENRKAHLEKLAAALQQFAEKHQGRFPEKESAAEIAPELWELPGAPGARFLYVAGLKTGDSHRILAYEPDVFGPRRLALQADGKVAVLASADLRKRLAEKRP